MNMLRADRLQRITASEDRARELRNALRNRAAPYAPELAELADIVAQALQAIREEI